MRKRPIGISPKICKVANKYRKIQPVSVGIKRRQSQSNSETIHEPNKIAKTTGY